ncbi:MAG: discoidin domain-containing protein [Prevotellaceae bacterium]|nr:discoidin domain-containing protein [Prevotellaceae bacterium]
MKKSLFIALLIIASSAFAQKQVISLESKNVTWQVLPQDDVKSSGLQISKPNFRLQGGVEGVVPGTVFTAYVATGKEKDPNFGNNILEVDETYYNRPFWYRTDFLLPSSLKKDQHVWLCFNNTNRYADFYFNGHKVSGTATSTKDINGHMMRSRFDVTQYARKGQRNSIAVLIYDADLMKTRHSKDNFSNSASPTYLPSAGWDWMPYVPGRLAGITGKCFVEITGGVTLVDPWIQTDLPTLDHADVHISAGIKNSDKTAKLMTVNGIIQPGNIQFKKSIRIPANTTSEITINKNDAPSLAIDNPRLWWPNGYGEPNLYKCKLTVTTDEGISDEKEITFGIKRYEYQYIENKAHMPVLTLFINGQKLFLKGGSWGMSEYMLRCHDEEYEKKIRLHRDMNFNMIRSWTGCVTDDEFYDYCDKYGIMVWNDFWLHNADGPVVETEAFKANALDRVRRTRNHPSIALWVGANETHPVDSIDAYLREMCVREDGRLYKGCSNQDGLSGSGGWGNRPPRYHFECCETGLLMIHYPYGPDYGYGLRSELGMGTMPNYESVIKFIPKEDIWPLPPDDTLRADNNNVWNTHYFGRNGLSAEAPYYKATVNSSFGDSENLEEFCEKAQYVNIEGMRGMFEAWEDKLNCDASGVLIWMSQSAFPSTLWQTYDYYYDATGSYWGAKQSCEPVHIMWNVSNNSVKVINTSPNDLKNVHAKATVYNLDGSIVESLCRDTNLYVRSADKEEAFVIPFPQRNVALGCTVTSSSQKDYNPAKALTDGKSHTRWESEVSDPQWICVDLGEVKNINMVQLYWEFARAREYNIDVSIDGQDWKTVYKNNDCKGGLERIEFAPVDARYVRMIGISRATYYAYSLYEMNVFETVPHDGLDLTNVNFLKLELTDANGKLLSQNLYWRNGYAEMDYRDINKLPKVALTTNIVSRNANEGKVVVRIKNDSSTICFGSRLRMVDDKGERILPLIMDDNYFTLLPGEEKTVTISTPDVDAHVLIKQYGQKEREIE